MTDEPDMVYQYDAYPNSNIFRISKYDNASNEYNRIIYLANDGSSLHEIDLSGNGYDNHFIDNYGTGKHLDTFLSDSNYHICYYDSVRNNLIERDHGKGSNYPSFIVHKTPVFKGALTDWPTDRCLIQISDYNGDGPDHDLFPVTYCDLIAVLDNPEDLNDMYTFADNESKLISFDQVHVADSIFVPFCPDATAVPKELSVKIFASNGNVGTTPLTDFDSFDSLDYYKIGNRYLLWAIAYGNPDSANIYLFSENGSESATIEVTNTNCFYSEWDRNTLVWRDDSEIDPTTYYLNAYETSINSPGTIDPFGRVEYTTSYATPDGLYPGNLFLQGGSSARLYRFNDVAPDSGNGIDDGGADMYNEGNLLVSSIAGNIPYTHTQMDGAEYDSNDEAPVEAFQMDGAVRSGASYFGGSSQYFTNLYPGLFVCVAKSIDIENFSIQGTTGMNSCGFNRTSYYDTTIGGIQYRAFLKTTNGGGDYFDGGSDPTINQIIIVDSQSGSLVQTIGETTADDLHKIEGFVAAEVGEIHYLLLSTYNKSVQQSLSDSEFHSIVDTYLTRVSGLTITATLSTLNAQYSVITNLFGTEDTYWTGVLRNNDYSYVETPYFEQMELGENICGGLYYNSESKICVNLYDLNMNLISTYTADEVEYNTFRIVGDRAYVETRNGDQKFLAIQKGTGFVRKEYDWNSNRWIRINDYPYWT
jgi:hypothetical protein